LKYENGEEMHDTDLPKTKTDQIEFKINKSKHYLLTLLNYKKQLQISHSFK